MKTDDMNFALFHAEICLFYFSLNRDAKNTIAIYLSTDKRENVNFYVQSPHRENTLARVFSQHSCSES